MYDDYDDYDDEYYMGDYLDWMEEEDYGKNIQSSKLE